MPTDRRAAFDSAYFRKYYFDKATRVTTAADMRGRAQLIAAVLRHAGIPVRSILDAGCGIGLLRKASPAALRGAGKGGSEAGTTLLPGNRGPKGSGVILQPHPPTDPV